MELTSYVQKIGIATLFLFRRLGHASLFLYRCLMTRPQRMRGCLLWIEQLYFVGFLSLMIIIVSALFIGMVIALQGYHTLQRFSAESQLGQLVALSVVRELGPVVTALLFAGRAGSALTAQIGLMQATRQLDSMEMMGVDPLWRIISPRLWAGIFAMPMLTIIFDAVAIYGAFLLASHWLGIDSGSFWSNMQTAVNFRIDVINGIIKSIFFGFVVTWIAVYQGYYAQPNAEGISRASTKTVVYASVLILALDFVLTATMLGG